MTARRLSILANNGDIGGGEVMLLALAEATRAAGYQVTVVAPETPGACADAGAERGFEVIRIPGEGRKAYMRGLRSWARGRSELLWCNGLVPATATALLRGSRRVVHLHRLPEGNQRILSRIARVGALDTVVPSRFMAGAVAGATVLPNWTAEIAQVGERSSSATFHLGFLGRLAPEKGIAVLLESLPALRQQKPAVELLIAGEAIFTSDEDVKAMQDAIANAGDQVTLTGWVERDAFFAQIDALVVPSVGPESFGLTAAEAMAAGVPVVVSDAGALPEVVGDGHPFVIRRHDAQALALTIGRLIDDPRATETATRAARERWEQEFSPSAGAARFVALLDDLVESKEEGGDRGL